TSPLIVTGCATSLRYSALSSSEPSGVEHMKSSAKISPRRFTSPFCTDATKSRFRAVSVSRSRCAFTFVCMAISSGVRRFLVQLRNEALVFDPQQLNTDWDFAIWAMIRVPDDWNFARHFLSTGYPRTYTQSSFFAGTWHVLQSVLKSVATFFFGSFASNKAHPHPSPHRSFLGNRPFESLTITNQILMSLVQVDCPVVSFSEPTVVTSFTRMAPSGNLPSRRYV